MYNNLLHWTIENIHVGHSFTKNAHILTEITLGYSCLKSHTLGAHVTDLWFACLALASLRYLT